MEYHSNPLKLSEGDEACKKSFKPKPSSRKRCHRTAKHCKLRSQRREKLQTQAKEDISSNDDSLQYVPIEERVLRKLKRERKLLKKWSRELKRTKNEVCNSNADDFSSVDPNISEIQKRYHILLPAIKLAMHTMAQAVISKSSMNDARSPMSQHQRKNQSGEVQLGLNEDMTTLGPGDMGEEIKRPRWLKDSMEHTLMSRFQWDSEKNLNNPHSKKSRTTDISKQHVARQVREKCENCSDQCVSEEILHGADSGNSLMAEISIQHLSRRAREMYIDSKKEEDTLKAVDTGEMADPESQNHCQSSKQISPSHVNNSSIQQCKPGADGEIMEERNVSDCKKQTLRDGSQTFARKFVKDEKVERLMQIGTRVESKMKPSEAVVLVHNKNHSGRNVRNVEQNVLCSGPNNVSQSPKSLLVPSSELLSTDLQSQTSLKAIAKSVKMYSSEGQASCACKDKKNSKPCICKCYCEEESAISESKSVLLPVPSAVPSFIGEDGMSFRKKPSLDGKNQESMQVQTSFPSSIGPCQPNTCPKRRKRFVENREIEVQTDDTDIEWQYEPPMTQTKRNVFSAFKIPPKRPETMDDRLLRRIMYFDCHQSSVCNKNVQFCTYSVHKTMKGFPKGADKVACSDCPGSRQCKIVLSQHPRHLTCNEIAVEVKSLELNQEGVDSLMKVCSFLYIDYVFLGHVGNETCLAPVSDNVLFDSRRSYSVSLRFNKKERSILREQFNPSGLLAKDSIMFIVVCQAAPEFDINKNWDFGFGYLSMKQIGEQMGSEDKISVEVEMQKIGGTKNKIGKLLVTIEGLKTIKIIMDEELRCIEPHVDAVMKKLKLNRKEMTAAERNRCPSKTKRKK